MQIPLLRSLLLPALLSRIAKQSGGDVCDDGTLAVSFSEMTASLSRKPLTFPPLEYRLLKILTKNPQTVLTRQVLPFLLPFCLSLRRLFCFRRAQETQLDKLDFLMQAMIKTSRLETGVISPTP